MEPTPPKHDLREIGHLFLSGLRQRQTGNAPRPVRISPRQRQEQPVELTPEEIAGVAGDALQPVADDLGDASTASLRVTCLVGGHLGARLHERALQHAGALAAAESTRVAVVELDPRTGTRITLVEAGVGEVIAATAAPDMRFAEALEELTWDVRDWVVVIPNPRAVEARAAVCAARHVAVLCDADADGAVSAYRTLKGLADLLRRDARPLPRLTLSMPAVSPDVAEATLRKLAAVSGQFLGWPLAEALVAEPSSGMTGTVAFADAAPPTPECWSVVATLVTRDAPEAAGRPAPVEPSAPSRQTAAAPAVPLLRDDPPAAPSRAHPTPDNCDEPPSTPPATASEPGDDVIELPDAATPDAPAVLSAVLAGCATRWAACPIVPPMCPEARVVVDRDRTLAVVGVVATDPERGAPRDNALGTLRRLALAHEWLKQNRGLVVMAVRQFAIDAHALPRLVLLVDHSAAAAVGELRPLLGGAGGHVRVMTFRTLRWSGRTGLLLDAA